MPFHQPKSVTELQKITGRKVAPKERARLQKVLDEHPVRLTNFLIKLMKKSPAIARQFLPDARELNPIGCEKPWVGLLDTGVPGLERMYLDRCIIMPFNQCPAYCRFCFRKFYEKRVERPVNFAELDQALAYVKNDERLTGILITGGDPLLDPKRLKYLLKNLREIKHVRDIRIGTRSLMYDPQRVTDKILRLILKYHRPEKMQPVEIATHFNHPDELSAEAKKVILKIAKSSIKLYNQTVLLKGINDDPLVLAELFQKLRLLGVEIYYLFHCNPVRGIGHLRTSIQKGIEIKKYFRGGQATGRINPAYVVDTLLGKVEIGVDGQIERRKKEKGGNYVWIKTPYRLETYRSVLPGFTLPAGVCKINSDGYISVRYLDGED